MRCLLLLCCLLGFVSTALAQFSIRGEVELAADATLDLDYPAQVGWTLAAHLAAEYQAEPFSLHLTLDPSLRFSEQIQAEPGLTEIYLIRRQGALDLSVGLERLPLEYARLTLPFTVERMNGRGVRQGVLGGRAVWYPAGWRLRAAVFYQSGLTPAFSVRRNFDDFELEAHLLYHERLIAGLGGSGLVGTVVIYGEAWLLTGPLDGRGALGLSGYLGDRLWTLEAAYASLRPEAPAFPILAGQISLIQSRSSNLELNLAVGFPTSGTQLLPTLSYTRLTDNGEVSFALNGWLGSKATAVNLHLSTKSFF